MGTHVNDVQRLGHTLFGREGESSVNFGRDLAGHNLQNLAAELDQQVVKGGINLVLDASALGFAILHSLVNESGIFWLLGSSKNEGRVGGGILRLVLVDCSEVTRVANDSLNKRC
jgi:hypothetical protein